MVVKSFDEFAHWNFLGKSRSRFNTQIYLHFIFGSFVPVFPYIATPKGASVLPSRILKHTKIDHELAISQLTRLRIL